MKWIGGIIFSAAALLAGTALSAEVFHVDRDFQGENHTGQSWFSAFPSVQEAIDAAAVKGGGEIWVKAGVYKPAETTREATFRLNPGTELYGGFRGNETGREQRNVKANRTILSGDIGRTGSRTDNCYHVVTGADGSRIDGFIIASGTADGKGTKGRGGGLLLGSSAKNFTVANCTFEKNHAATGGAIHTVSTGTTLSNCTFYANSADSGGALVVDDGGDVTAKACTFTSNFAKESGGAIALRSSSKTLISHSWFLFNRTEGSGGAIAGTSKRSRGIELAVEDSEFSENSATETGGALFSEGSFYPVVSRCNFRKNASTKGAGAMANRDGATVALLESTLSKNRSADGFAEIDGDTSADIVKGEAEAPPVVEPEPVMVDVPKRTLANIVIHDASGDPFKLRSMVEKNDYTVLSTADLTDPEFLASYRTIEAAARDYSGKGVGFFYIYCYLLHPENHGYVQPITLTERARQIMDAKRLLRTRVDWLCDSTRNDAAKTLDREKNNLFIYTKGGVEEYAGNITDGKSFRIALGELAGRIKSPTRPERFTPPDLAPVNMQEAQYVNRAKIDPTKETFQALQITSGRSRLPYYAKLRAEANEALLETGTGRMYLGFHLDPLYRVEWNNLGKPLRYAIKVPRGIALTPSINEAEKVSVGTDNEPREFLLNIRKWNPKVPIPITVSYTVHSDRSKRTIEVTQRYLLKLERDPFGGTVIGRQISEPRRNGKKGRR